MGSPSFTGMISMLLFSEWGCKYSCLDDRCKEERKAGWTSLGRWGALHHTPGGMDRIPPAMRREAKPLREVKCPCQGGGRGAGNQFTMKR